APSGRGDPPGIALAAQVRYRSTKLAFSAALIGVAGATATALAAATVVPADRAVCRMASRTVSGESPSLATRSGRTDTPPTSRSSRIAVGASAMSGGGTPVPVRATVDSASSGSSLWTVSVAGALPAASGWKVTSTGREAPAARVNPAAPSVV